MQIQARKRVLGLRMPKSEKEVLDPFVFLDIPRPEGRNVRWGQNAVVSWVGRRGRRSMDWILSGNGGFWIRGDEGEVLVLWKRNWNATWLST